MFATFLASAVTGMTGFGFALILVPALTVVLSPREVVPIIYVLGTVSTIMVMLETRKWIELARIWPLVFAGVLSAPLGTYLLLILDAETLKILIGALSVLTALALMADLKLTIRNERAAGIGVGIASGLVGGSTGMAGPPVILFFSNQGKQKHVFRANITSYYFILGMSMLLSQYSGGLITRSVLSYSLWLVPSLFAGTLIGMKLARRVSEGLFRRIALVIVVASGLVAVATGLGWL